MAILESRFTAYLAGQKDHSGHWADEWFVSGDSARWYVPVKGTRYGRLSGLHDLHRMGRTDAGAALDCGTRAAATQVVELINRGATPVRVAAAAAAGRQAFDRAVEAQRRALDRRTELENQLVPAHRWDWETMLIQADALEEDGCAVQAAAMLREEARRIVVRIFGQGGPRPAPHGWCLEDVNPHHYFVGHFPQWVPRPAGAQDSRVYPTLVAAAARAEVLNKESHAAFQAVLNG